MAINKFFRALVGYFFQGLLYLAPISITLYIIYYAFVYIDGLLDEYIMEYLGFNIPGLGILIILISIALIGFILSSIIFRPLWRILERLLLRAPLVKIIYTSVKDLLEAFVGQKKKFTEPVLVKINNTTDLQKIGFITARDLDILGLGNEKVAVYLPHSYAFSGNLFIAPVENITPINAPPAEVMKFIVSAGVTKI
jgi:uncharacterized membrane protein